LVICKNGHRKKANRKNVQSQTGNGKLVQWENGSTKISHRKNDQKGGKVGSCPSIL